MSRAAFVALLLSAAALALPAPDAGALDLPSDPALLDLSGDGVVDFAAFAHFAASQGVSRTEAAQHFTRLSDGDTAISASEYFFAVRVESGASWEAGYDAYADWSEEIDIASDGWGRILDITPNEEVAGEVVRAFEGLDPGAETL